MKNKKLNSKGFTLIELLVTMTIISIVMGMSIPLLRNVTESATNRKYETFKDSLIYASKLFIDSYSQDLFDNRISGCAYIDLNSLIERRLAKDIEMDNISCNTPETFVQVIKTDDTYSYKPFIKCGVKDEDGTIEENGYSSPEGTHIKDETICGFDSTFNMEIAANIPESDESHKSYALQININSYTGINSNANLSYGFSTTENESDVISWNKLSFDIPDIKEQKVQMGAGNKITAQSKKIYTPSTAGLLYFIVKTETLSDLYGTKWTSTQDKIIKFGPYRLDNTKPEMHSLTLIKEDGKWRADAIIVDSLNYENDYKLCLASSELLTRGRCQRKDNFTLSLSGSRDVTGKVKQLTNGWYDLCAVVMDHAGNIADDEFCSNEVRYTVKVYQNDGTNNYSTTDVVLTEREKAVTNASLASTIPDSRPGYTFLNWSLEKNTNVPLNPNANFVESTDKIYAFWQPNEFTITLKNADPKGKIETITGNYVDDIYLPDKTYPGFTFTGWSGGTWGSPRKGTDALINPYNNQRVYVGSWQANRYEIKLTNLGTADKKEYYNTPTVDTVKIANPTRSGYTFIGWSGTDITGMKKDLELPLYTYGDKEYRANWTRN